MAKDKNKADQKKREYKRPKNNGFRIFGGIVSILLSLASVLGIIGGAGSGGNYISKAVWNLFGAGYILFPISFAILGSFLLLSKKIEATTREWTSAIIGLISSIGFLSVISGEAMLGGYFGKGVASILVYPFDRFFAGTIFFFVSFGSFIVFFDRNPKTIFEQIKEFVFSLKNLKISKPNKDEYFENTQIDETPPETEEGLEKEILQKETFVEPNNQKEEEEFIHIPKKRRGAYVPPPVSLLEGDRGKANVGDVKANANIIRRTLANFGIEVEMDEVTIGPTVTRYALKPAQGVKLSRIAGLQNDLALALAAHPIRMELPIPGKSLVGIEIPNKTKATIGLANLITDPIFKDNHRPLVAAFGRNISGKPICKSLARMPHLLIAGTTGSGKSVTIHAIITSLLYKNGPDDLRFIFVDPKRVELTLYNKIPHLLTPVITDPKKAILSLKWAANEMNRRYDILESEAVRDIESYHRKHANNFGDNEDSPDRMPYIVIVIDELADIMASYPRELESAIVRLAQMSRAVGIHLVLSTQRPEVNVITGLIKANIPSRVALRVPTQIDSRTILDASGAEKLLGAGDMLAILGENQPERLQSAFITEEEVKSVVKYLANAFKDEIQETIELTGSVSTEKTLFDAEMGDDDDDELYEEARKTVMEAGKASTSYIQRKLKVGYARAARLMDMLEQRKVIGPSDGAKPRELLEKPLRNAESDIINSTENL